MKQKVPHKPLKQLIMKLSVSERSYFKGTARYQVNPKKSLQMKLFNLLSREKDYTTDVLCKLLNIQSKTHLSNIKTRLFDELLDMKISLRKKENIDSQLHFAQQQAAILMEQNLFEPAEKVCSKAIILAKHFAKYSFLSMLLHLKNNIGQFSDYKKYKTESSELLKEIQSAIRHEHALQQIKLYFEQVKILGYRSWLPISDKELKEVREMSEKVKRMYQTSSFMHSVQEETLIKLYFLNTKAFCCYLLHEKEACTEACIQIFNSWKAAPHLVNEYAWLFIYSMNTTSYNDFFCNQITRARENLQLYSTLAEVHLASCIHSKIFLILRFNTELKIYHKTFRYDLVKQIVDEQSAILLSYSGELLPRPDALSLPTSIFISYFVLEQWDEAEMVLLKVKEQNRNINRQDILFFTLIFHLLILYEKKEWYRMDIVTEAAYHFLYSRKMLRLFERKMLLFLKHLASTRNQAETKALCNKFLGQLQKLNEGETPVYSLYFNFPGWVESKIKGMHYMDYTREQMEKDAV